MERLRFRAIGPIDPHSSGHTLCRALAVRYNVLLRAQSIFNIFHTNVYSFISFSQSISNFLPNLLFKKL